MAGGTGATAVAVLGTGTMAQQVVGINVTSPGFGYTSNPIVSISGGGGSGAAAAATIDIISAVSGDGFTLDPGSDGSTIKGLNIVDFHESANAAGVAIHSLYDTVAATWIGVDASVPFAPFYAGNVDGIRIENGGGSARIGLPTTGGRNVISGNDGDAIDINGGGFNTVENTYIGTDFNGTLIVDQNVGFNLYNLGNGITIENGSQFNAIGAAYTRVGFGRFTQRDRGQLC